MGILSFNTNTTGLVGDQVDPRRVTMVTTDNLATITTAGYLNNANVSGYPISPTDIFDVLYSFDEQTKVGTFGIFQITYSIATGFTLNEWENPGDVLLPVVSGDFATFNGTSGQIKDAGYLPSNPAKTVVVMAGSAVVANHMALFADTSGTIDDTAATAINNGSIQAGLSGTAGTLISFPGTASKGSLIVAGVANTGDTNVTISNALHGQASVYSIPDGANAVGRFLVGATATPFVSGNFPVASGTAGLMVDSGVPATNIQNKTNIKAATTGNIGGAGAGPITVTVAGVTTASVIIATIATSSNAVSVVKAVAGTGNFDVTFSGDPGATCTLNYVAFIAGQ